MSEARQKAMTGGTRAGIGAGVSRSMLTKVYLQLLNRLRDLSLRRCPREKFTLKNAQRRIQKPEANEENECSNRQSNDYWYFTIHVDKLG